VLEDIGGRWFAPLVSRRIETVAALDVLFLRHQAPGQMLYEGGDIDNRIKTLLDALRMPSVGELQQIGQTAQYDEQPFYCLLQDDALVTKLTVETDRLLIDSDAHDLLAVLHVHVRSSRSTMDNLGIVS
jgi:hypothetical protein